MFSVQGLQVCANTGRGLAQIVREVSFSIAPGRTLGLVGESGSGKSATALAPLGLVHGVDVAGSARFDGLELVGASSATLRAVRGTRIGVIFQNPQSALHPTLTVETQVAEALRARGPLSRRAAVLETVKLLERVGLPDAFRLLACQPHELSGGQQQRVIVAMAIAAQPQLLIADEPTTALDSETRAGTISLLQELQRNTEMAILLISHDLDLVAHLADDVAVMYAGRVVEFAAAGDLTTQPAHPYTRGLLGASISLTTPLGQLPEAIPGAPPPVTASIAGCAFADRCPDALPAHRLRRPELVPMKSQGHLVACWTPGASRSSEVASPQASEQRVMGSRPPAVEVQGVSKAYRSARKGRVTVVEDVSLTVSVGETVGLVGPSGCGKSTLARLIAGLTKPNTGRITFGDRDLTHMSRRDAAGVVQVLFQDPYGSLNSRRRVGDIVADGLHQLEGTARSGEVARLLEVVGLDPAMALRMPATLSGGERQRVALARALGPRPRVLVADEPLTALDASVQVAVLGLLKRVQQKQGLALLLIAHDLAAVRVVSDRIAVMCEGRIVEVGEPDTIVRRPTHEATKRLVAASLLNVSARRA